MNLNPNQKAISLLEEIAQLRKQVSKPKSIPEITEETRRELKALKARNERARRELKELRGMKPPVLQEFEQKLKNETYYFK